MSLHEYHPVHGTGCALCCYGFERLHKAGEAPLTHCPACGTSLRRVLAAPALIDSAAQHLAPAHLARHGFSQYRRLERGRYEKIAGDGPDQLGDD
ncbi:MAG: hypothetical protein F9K31_01035 [Dokdonella sp.]|nr:MAG: hypothetical protein F9K31_01035 [Dokdonella sp.]